MFNLPNLDFLQTPEWQQYIQGLMAGETGLTSPLSNQARTIPVPTNSFKVDGSRYTGPFAKQDVMPFRTVSGIGGYGQGRNASAAQIYDHFSGAQYGGGRKYSDHGLKGINPKTGIQTIQDFLARRNPTRIEPSNVNTPNGPNPNTNAAMGQETPQQLAMNQFDRGNIFGQLGNISSNFQPPMPPLMAGMGKGR